MLYPFHLQVAGSGGIALGKLETDLARFIHDQPRRKRAAGLGNEFLQQICSARRQQFGHLPAFDGPLQNGLARLEFARLFLRLRLLAEVIRFAFEHPPAAAGTFADRLQAREIELGLRLLLCVLGGLPLALLELETDLAVLAEHEKRLEGAAVAFGDEFIQQIGLAAGQQLLNLRGGKRLLKDDRSDPEIALAFLADRLFARVVHPVFEDAVAALWTFPEGLLAGEIDRLRRTVRAISVPRFVAEIEFESVLRVEAYDRGEVSALPAAEALQGSDALF